VVPHGQDVISWRPRGDASLLGHNSTATWWCLIKLIRIVKCWCFIWFGTSYVDVCYACLNIWMVYRMYDTMISSLVYPFACLCVMCGFLLCDDHQPRWCEHMWDLPTVVIMEVLRFDKSWTSIGLTLGTHNFWEFSSSSPFALDEILYLV